MEGNGFAARVDEQHRRALFFHGEAVLLRLEVGAEDVLAVVLVVVVLVHGFAVEAALQAVAVHLADGGDGGHRRREGLPGDFDEQHFGDTHRERHAQGELGAFAAQRVHANLAAPLFDHFIDHVHADAASRQL